MSDKVFVYLYQYWDEQSQSHKTSTLYATMDVIRSGLGTPVLATELEVDRLSLRDGMYAPPVANDARFEAS